MIKKNDNQPDVNTIGKSAAVFTQYYNENIPGIFPQVTAKDLEKFRVAHPNLFKGSSEWTIDKHRKKLMDWLVSNRNVDKK